MPFRQSGIPESCTLGVGAVKLHVWKLGRANKRRPRHFTGGPTLGLAPVEFDVFKYKLATKTPDLALPRYPPADPTPINAGPGISEPHSPVFDLDLAQSR